MSLGEKIRKLRLSKDITQKELADKLNVSFQTISKWENNINEPDLTSIKKLSNIFGCPIDFFFEDDEVKVNESLNNLENKEKEIEVKEEKSNDIYLDDQDTNYVDRFIDQKKDINKKDESICEPLEEVKEVDTTNKEVISVEKSNGESLAKEIGTCEICKKNLYSFNYYFVIKKIKEDGEIESKYYCNDCYEKNKDKFKLKVGHCNDCFIDLYENDDYRIVRKKDNFGTEKNVYLCADCYKKEVDKQNNYKKTSKNESKDKVSHAKANSKNITKKKTNPISYRADKTVIKWSIVLGIIAFILTLVACIYNYNIVGIAWTICLPVLFGYMVLSTIYCLFSETYISDVFAEIASKVIRFPGLIVEFSLDGFAWLIAMKLLFAVLGFLIGLGFILLATFVAIFLSFFSYVPLLHYNETHYRNLKD